MISASTMTLEELQKAIKKNRELLKRIEKLQAEAEVIKARIEKCYEEEIFVKH